MSTNRTVVELVAVEAVACAEAADLALDLLPLRLEELRQARNLLLGLGEPGRRIRFLLPDPRREVLPRL